MSEMVRILKTKKEVQAFVSSLDKGIDKLGFVPTMGYLHKGHLSLVEEAKKRCEQVIVSIFVNPTQFGINEDFSTYPRDLSQDIELLSDFEPIYVFAPDNSEMYKAGHKSYVVVDELSGKLCGKRRKDHFRGVATVVTKLLNIVSPDLVFMGEKDYQQIVVLEQMISDLNFLAKIVHCPIVREESGLAMSSRNKYLNDKEKEGATSLYRSLILAQRLFKDNVRETNEVVSQMRSLIESNGGIIDYIEVVDSATLDSIDRLVVGCRIVLAVYFGETRLIDNIEITC